MEEIVPKAREERLNRESEESSRQQMTNDNAGDLSIVGVITETGWPAQRTNE